MQAMAPGSKGDLQAGHSVGVAPRLRSGAEGAGARGGGGGGVGAAGAGRDGAPTPAATGWRAGAAATANTSWHDGQRTCLPPASSGTCIGLVHFGQRMI